MALGEEFGNTVRLLEALQREMYHEETEGTEKKKNWYSPSSPCRCDEKIGDKIERRRFWYQDRQHLRGPPLILNNMIGSITRS